MIYRMKALVPQTTTYLLFFLVIGCSFHKRTADGVAIDHKQEPVSEDRGDTVINVTKADSGSATTKTEQAKKTLTQEESLYIKACDNYITVNPEGNRVAEVISLKGMLYYKKEMYENARETFKTVVKQFPKSMQANDGIRMIAQSYYDEKNFEKAEVWYRKFSAQANEGVSKAEAKIKIAESIFRLAGQMEKDEDYKQAAGLYEKIVYEFPEVPFSDIALLNAGLCYEKREEWDDAIMLYQRLLNKYDTSRQLPKASFRIAKCYEKLEKWELAGKQYLKLVSAYPESELSPIGLYNAGYSFEKAGKLAEAASVFEKMAHLYPESQDAADVLFRAGEIYGKVKDWESVRRVNSLFTDRYGENTDRVVQALCMSGIALYMQEMYDEAIRQLQKTVNVYKRITDPSTTNSFYAAKANFTIGEIYHTKMNGIRLQMSEKTYNKKLKVKADLLEKSVQTYGEVLQYGIFEWTSRSVFSIGKVNEEFGESILKQPRPKQQGTNEMIALELGILQAYEKYTVEHALHYYEQNVKISIKEKLENEYIDKSRSKLTFLSYSVAKKYIDLSEVASKASNNDMNSGLASIGNKLQILQKVAPYQERAIGLLLKCLALGTTYQEKDEHYRLASATITDISLKVGATYNQVVTVARDAPIPEGFDSYERFIYKTKLVNQVKEYEDQAIENYMKVVKIGDVYSIDDDNVQKAKEKVAELLFIRGRCYDLLSSRAVETPPLPDNIEENEKDEYRQRLVEAGEKFKEEAFRVYEEIYDLAQKNYTAGPFVTHAYVRLFQNAPKTFGIATSKIVDLYVASSKKWMYAVDTIQGWNKIGPGESDKWRNVLTSSYGDEPFLKEFSKKIPEPISFDTMHYSAEMVNSTCKTIFFRRTIYIPEIPLGARFYIGTDQKIAAFLNGYRLEIDTGKSNGAIYQWNILSKIKKGKNVVGIKMEGCGTENNKVFPLITMKVKKTFYLPKPPHENDPMSIEKVALDVYTFPYIRNFSMESDRL